MDAAAHRVTKTTPGTPLENLTWRAYNVIGVPLLVTSLSYDFLWVASSLLERFGWREDALVGRTLHQILGPNQASISLLPTAAEVIRRGQWSTCGTIDLGQPQVRHVRLSVHAIADGNGPSSALAVTLEDVTKATESTERLDQVEALLHGFRIGIAWSDASGEYLAGMNPAYYEMQGDPPASLVGNGILDRFP
jgi:hypothetical protein